MGLCVPYRLYGGETTPASSTPAHRPGDANNARPIVAYADVMTEHLSRACGVTRQPMRSDIDRMRCPALLMCL